MVLIYTLLSTAVTATKVVTFHDGIQVPHARAATNEVYYDNSLLPSKSLIKPHLRTPDYPVVSGPDEGSVISDGVDVGLRNEWLYLGLQDPEHRDVSFDMYNQLREADGLGVEPKSYEEVLAEKNEERKKEE